MTTIQIKHSLTGSVLFEADCDSMAECLALALRSGANLNGAKGVFAGMAA